jgi:hypothetical protein
MARKRHKPEEIVAKLRQVDVLVFRELPVRAALRRGVLRAENSAYGQSYAQCLWAA